MAINDPTHFGVLADNDFKQLTITHALERCDCILIEGYKQSPFNKIVFLDGVGKLPIPPDSKGICAIVHQGTGPLKQFVEQGIPLFHRDRSEEHTSELQSRRNLVCRLLLEKKKITYS